MIRFGWAFVGLDSEEKVVAIARGTPPSWIVDIPGTEAWALYQAGLAAEPGSSFRADCRPCVDAIAEGEKLSCSAKRSLARVNRLMHHVMDDTSRDKVVWMPAHTSEADVGNKRLSDGIALTATDRATNGKADKHAKAAAQKVRVPAELRRDYDDYSQNVLMQPFGLGWSRGCQAACKVR